MSGPVFRTLGLTKTYRMGTVEVQALRSFDLDLCEFSVLLGASGSGKSTLLNVLGGLNAATTGRVLPVGMEHRLDYIPAGVPPGTLSSLN